MLKRFAALVLAAAASLGAGQAHADAYTARPRLVVLVVIDQFRADYLERYRADFKGDGFRLFLDHGAWFPDCYYAYANTKTAPGHSTLATGAYTNGHGIAANEWWDLARNRTRPVTAVEDARYKLIGAPVEAAPTSPASGADAPANGVPATPTQATPTQATPTQATPTQAAPTQTGPTEAVPVPAALVLPGPGASPRNLLASTLGDELRLATQGRSRLYGVSLKDRAAILTAGHAANGAFWVDPKTGRFITSTYYMTALPQWAIDFDNGSAIEQADTAAGIAAPTNFYDQVGATNAGNTYEIQFAEALITGEQLGQHAATDMLTLSLSPNDLEGHAYGPDSPQEHAMVDGLDGDLDGFFTWLDQNVPGGLANVVIALSADHGIAPTPAVSAGMGLPGTYVDVKKLVADLNQAMNAKFSPGENDMYLLGDQQLPYLSLNQSMFERAGIVEQEAEDAVKAAVPHAFASLAAPAGTLLPAQATPGSAPFPVAQSAAAPAALATTAAAVAATGPVDSAASQPPAPAPPRAQPEPQLFRDYTRVELAAGQVPPTPFGQLMANSYSPNGGWYVAVWPIAFQMEGAGSGTTHFSPYSYDRHVPLAFYGAAFIPGTYRGNVQPVDLAVTLASLLGINEPSAAVGQVLTEALKPAGEYPYAKPEVAPRRHVPVRAHQRRTTHPAAAAPETPHQP